MNRTTRLKVSGVVGSVLLAALAGWAFIVSGKNVFVLFGMVLLLFVPGRLQGFFYRDFFIGRRLSDQRQWTQAINYLHRFLESLTKHPERELMLWLSWSVYTTSAQAMALNNLGAATLELCKIDEAESFLLRAIERDPPYPIPHFNMALIWELRGDRERAIAALEKARELGFSGGALDRLVIRAQSILARIEGSATT